MSKKLSLLAMVVAALAAFAIPAAANAAPSITSSAGVLAPVGTILTAKSTNAKTVTSLATLTCREVAVNGELSENTGTSVMVERHGEGTTSGCEALGASIRITDPTLITLTATPTLKTVKLTFIADILGASCHFEGDLTFSYTAGSSSIHISGTVTSATGGICPSTGTFSGDFAITIGATPVILD
jgi:hypothetical protein